MRELLAVPADGELAALDSRAQDDNPPADRTHAARDRDRVLYCSAFQRLGHVTQVTAPEVGLGFHSRLTHSLKVAQFARRFSERLKRGGYVGGAARAAEALDPDAAACAALAHDIGHPPFGHLAEEELNRLASSFGGYEGNAQSFRVVTRLALRSPNYLGLNLTRRSLNGILKYPWERDDDDKLRSKKWNVYHADLAPFNWVREGSPADARSIEAQVMDWSDDVTYAVHDMDDFFRAGLVPLDRLCSEAPELEAFQEHVTSTDELGEEGAAVAETLFRDLLGFKVPYTGAADERIQLRAAGSGLITRYLRAASLTTDAQGNAYFAIDDSLKREVDVLKQLIWFYVIERPSLAILQSGQRRTIKRLYEMYEDAALKGQTRLFPALYRARLGTADTDHAKRRIVVDLIASLTEPEAVEIFRRMTGISGGSIGDPAGRLT